eukprot:scaffold5708_cov107-Isochrysis_galbana.AAC.18
MSFSHSLSLAGVLLSLLVSLSAVSSCAAREPPISNLEAGLCTTPKTSRLGRPRSSPRPPSAHGPPADEASQHVTGVCHRSLDKARLGKRAFKCLGSLIEVA